MGRLLGRGVDCGEYSEEESFLKPRAHMLAHLPEHSLYSAFTCRGEKDSEVVYPPRLEVCLVFHDCVVSGELPVDRVRAGFIAQAFVVEVCLKNEKIGALIVELQSERPVVGYDFFILRIVELVPNFERAGLLLARFVRVNFFRLHEERAVRRLKCCRCLAHGELVVGDDVERAIFPCLEVWNESGCLADIIEVDAAVVADPVHELRAG